MGEIASRLVDDVTPGRGHELVCADVVAAALKICCVRADVTTRRVEHARERSGHPGFHVLGCFARRERSAPPGRLVLTSLRRP